MLLKDVAGPMPPSLPLAEERVELHITILTLIRLLFLLIQDLGMGKFIGQETMLFAATDRKGLFFGGLSNQTDKQSPNTLLYSFPYIHAFI